MGSIDLDTGLAKDLNHANAHRWDYGVGFHGPKGQRRCAVWIEVLPANPGAATGMLRKAAWLRAWLAGPPTIGVLTHNGMRLTRGDVALLACGEVVRMAPPWSQAGALNPVELLRAERVHRRPHPEARPVRSHSSPASEHRPTGMAEGSWNAAQRCSFAVHREWGEPHVRYGCWSRTA